MAKESTAEASRMLKCTGCCKKYYCSEQCQKLAWKEHRKGCRRMSNEVDMLVLDDNKVRLSNEYSV